MAENSETTVIGADSHFKGELEFEKTARINGKFDGKISGKGELQISQNALCKADVDAASLQIDGTVEGNVQANDTIKLNANGMIRGDVNATKMVMSEGASLFGQVAIGPNAKKPGAAPSSTTTSGGVSSSPGTRSEGAKNEPPKK